MTASALDSVKGLGESRRNALVGHFGSVAKLKEATVADIIEVPGIGEMTAKAVLTALSGETASGAPGVEVGDDGPGGGTFDGGERSRQEATSTGQA